MDSQIFANSIVTLKGTDLRMVYALFCKTNIGDLLFSKTKDVFSKENSDHFTKHLEAEVKKLKYESDAKIQVDLFLEITKMLKLRGTKYTLEKEITDQCTNIMYEAYALLQKQDKKFRVFAEKQLHSTKLQQMVQYQMSTIFNELDGKFQDFSMLDQSKFAAQVNEYIHSLPEDKQNKIKDKLGINDLTDEVVRKAIVASGTSIVFAVIVEVSGFAFYTTATSLLASFAGLFGLTLPFGVYTGLTSTIAVLANPLFIIPLLLGGGALLINHQNKSLRKKLLPIIVMQIALPFMSKGFDAVQFDSFIQEWEKRYEQYKELHHQLLQFETEQKEVRSWISEKDNTILEYKTQIHMHEKQIENKKQSIKLDLTHTELNLVDAGESFCKHIEMYEQIKDEIQSLKQLKEERASVSTGFFQRIGNTVSNLSTSMDIRNKENELDKILEIMVEDILYSQSTYKQHERESIHTLKEAIKLLKTEKRNEENQKDELEIKFTSLNGDIQSMKKQKKKHEKNHYGIEDLLMTG